MSLDSVAAERVPELTARMVRAAFPNGKLAIRVREVLSPVFDDERVAWWSGRVSMSDALTR